MRRALTAVRLAGVEHPPIVLEALCRQIGIAHHAEDVVEFQHGTGDARPSRPRSWTGLFAAPA
jgi:hypothetical protein